MTQCLRSGGSAAAPECYWMVTRDYSSACLKYLNTTTLHKLKILRSFGLNCVNLIHLYY